MKKLFITSFFICLTAITFGQAASDSVRISTPNSGLGDPIRTAFQRVNRDMVAVRDTEIVYRSLFVNIIDSLLNKYTKAQITSLLSAKANLASPTFTGTPKIGTDTVATRAYARGNGGGGGGLNAAAVGTQIGDTVTARLAAAPLISSVAWLKTDTVSGQGKQVVTQTQLSNFSGGGSGVGMYELSGQVGVTTGFPANGDSLIINTGFIDHPRITVYREGKRQQMHADNTTTDGFWFNNTTGTITFRPVLSSNEQIIVDAFDPIVWHDLVAQGGSGGGGNSGASSLLTGLVAGWQMDETGGTSLADVLGVNTGTISGGTPNQTGEFGKCVRQTKRSNYIDIPHSASLQPSGTALSISLWFKLDSLPSVTNQNMWLVYAVDATYNYSYECFVNKTTNYIAFYLKNNSGVDIECETANSAVTAGTWYNLILEVNGTSTYPKIYLNGSDVSSYHPNNFSGTIHHIQR